MLFYISILFLLIAAVFALMALRQNANVILLTKKLPELNALLVNLREAYMDLETTKPLRELGQSTAFINHEIKNYMMLISGYATLLQRSGALSAKDRGMVDNIAQASAKLHDLNISVLEQSKSKIRREYIEFDLIQKLKTCIDARFGGQLAKFSVECDTPDGSVPINGNPDKLEQVFINAFRNSLEAGAQNISVRLSVHNYMALIIIEDDGAGCSAEQFPNLFKTFFTTKQNIGGTGLGLCVVRSTVEAHVGNVNIYSKNLLGGDEHGLSMQITIPATRKATYSAVKSEILLIKNDLCESAHILQIMKNLKIIPRVADWPKNVETAKQNASIDLTVLAAPTHIEDLKEIFGGEQGIRILSVQAAQNGTLLVSGTDDGSSPELLTEEYVIRQLYS